MLDIDIQEIFVGSIICNIVLTEDYFKVRAVPGKRASGGGGTETN